MIIIDSLTEEERSALNYLKAKNNGFVRKEHAQNRPILDTLVAKKIIIFWANKYMLPKAYDLYTF